MVFLWWWSVRKFGALHGLQDGIADGTFRCGSEDFFGVVFFEMRWCIDTGKE
jgi:hypothetical protein